MKRKRPRRRGLGDAPRCTIKRPRRGTLTQDFVIDLECDGELTGYAEVTRRRLAGEDLHTVAGIYLDKPAQRKKLGTKLYEAAAEEACKRGAPLASHYRVGPMSAAFWEKQLRKGRARVVSPTLGKHQVDADALDTEVPAPIYALTCPAPASLAGGKRRKPRV